MNKLVFLFLAVGLCKTIDAYCIDAYEPAVYVPYTVSTYACPNTCSSCMPCSAPVLPCSTPVMACSTPCNSCSMSDCVKSCTQSMRACDGGCDAECRCLKACTNFPEVEYPTMCNVGISPCYYY